MGFAVSLLICTHGCIVAFVAYVKVISLCAISTVFGNISYLAVCVGKLMCRQGFHIAVRHTRN